MYIENKKIEELGLFAFLQFKFLTYPASLICLILLDSTKSGNIKGKCVIQEIGIPNFHNILLLQWYVHTELMGIILCYGVAMSVMAESYTLYHHLIHCMKRSIS